MKTDAQFFARLVATFKAEAAEHLQAISAGLIALERCALAIERPTLLETVFRAAHSLKGAARAVDLTEIESVCQSLEEMFAGWRRQQTSIQPAAFDSAHHALNKITTLLNESEPSLRHEQNEQGSVQGMARGLEASPSEPASTPKSSTPTVRVELEKLGACLLEAEEMLSAKLALGQRSENFSSLSRWLETWLKGWALFEPDGRELRRVASNPVAHDGRNVPSFHIKRLLELLDRNFQSLQSLQLQLAAECRKLDRDRQSFAKVLDALLDTSKDLLLLPFSSLAGQFPKLVRDLCRDVGKQASLEVQGAEVEIDKRVLDEMKDPLVHLLRNCIDHGVEMPEERLRRNKTREAKIKLSASLVGDNKVEIKVQDDGTGLDFEKVRATAVARGILSQQTADQLSEDEVRAMVFEPEISTSATVTRISGRGIGLAIVRENVERLGGIITLETQKGQGTAFRILIPTTLATFRGIPVESSGQIFVVPTRHVERVARVQREQIRSVEGRAVVAFSNRTVSLASLAGILNLKQGGAGKQESATLMVLILIAGEQRIAIGVDAVLGEHEVLLKPFRRPLHRVRNLAGATVLPSGKLAPILNVLDLFKSARQAADSFARKAEQPAPENKSVLVAEDSITSRMLIKGILESAGFKVKTAVDGLEAFTLLHAEPFDLVVSDVEMPRLNGFELTSRIRADRRLTDLPVILVTALEKQEHRERGIDVGANAYLVKSSFDQSNLLDAVRRLA